MTTLSPKSLVDLQAAHDGRGVALAAVGVAGVRCPIRVAGATGEQQSTNGLWRMGVAVESGVRGAHLSRFMELIADSVPLLTLQVVGDLLAELRRRQHAETAEMEVEFDYFIRKYAPVSRAVGWMDYRCAFIGRDCAGVRDLVLRVDVPVATLCPCSKAISDDGAHNQRTRVRVEVRADHHVTIEEIVAWVEASGSCPLFPTLKRVDEKWVTEHAYNTPRFVEDVVRELVVRVRGDGRIRSCRVEASSDESIHNHNAYAVVEWTQGAEGSGLA